MNLKPPDLGIGTQLCEPASTAEKGFFRNPRLRGLSRFFTWWLVIAGIYASSSVCPFCGQPGCPVGGLGAGLVGGFFALVITKGRAWLQRLADSLAWLRSWLRFPSQT